MKVILFIFLPFIIFNFDIRSYSINILLDYLKGTGYYSIIENIKQLFGDDVAIDFCEVYVGSKDCKEVVQVYMSEGTNPKKAPIRNEDSKNLELIEVLLQEENLKILSQFYTKNEIIEKARKILNMRTDKTIKTIK